LPAGGAPLSGCFVLIAVGVAWNALSWSAAFVTPAPPPELELVPEPELLLELLSEPQAATVMASASAAMMAGKPRGWVIDLSSEM
jgi:hypothetical protein